MQVLHKSEERCGTGRYLRKGAIKRRYKFVFLLKVATPKTHKRATEWQQGCGGEGIRVENINYSIIMCDAQWEKEGRRRGTGGRARECLRQWENFVWQQWLICGKNIPQRVTEKLWTPDTSRHCGTERGRTMQKKKRRSKRIQSKGKFFSFVIV